MCNDNNLWCNCKHTYRLFLHNRTSNDWIYIEFISILNLHEQLHRLGVTDWLQLKIGTPCWCIVVFIEQLRRMYIPDEQLLHTNAVVNICCPPVNGSWSFRAIVWIVLVVGVLLLLARRPGIRCQTVFVTQRWVWTFSGVVWRHTFCVILTKYTQRIRRL